MTADAAAARTTPIRPDRSARTMPGTAVVSAATLGSGLLAYAFLLLAGRALGPEAYGRVAALWGLLFLVTVVLFRPLEQTVSRQFADRLERGEGVRSVARACVALYLVIVGIGGLLLVLGWEPLTSHLLFGNDLLTTAFAVGVVGYGAAYLARGAFAGSGWFGGYGLVLLVDAAARLLIALPLAVAASVDLAATAIAAATLIGVCVPLVLGRRFIRELVRRPDDEAFNVGAATRFAVPAGVIAGVDQLLVNGAPVLVIAAHGAGAAKDAGIVFAATMLVRVPAFLLQGVAAALLPGLTRLHVAATSAAFNAALARATGLMLGAGAVIVAAIAAAGPEGITLLFGDAYAVERSDLVLLAVGVAWYLGAVTISQALLARGFVARAALCWVGVATAYVALFAASDGTSLHRASLALAGATALGFVSLALAVALRRAR